MEIDSKPVGIGHNSRQKPPKSAKDRAKSHYQRKTEAGWKKTWVDPGTLTLIEELGSVEAISTDRDELLKKIDEKDAELNALHSRGLLSRLLNRKFS